MSPNKTLQSLLILYYVAASPTVTATIIRFNGNPCYIA